MAFDRHTRTALARMVAEARRRLAADATDSLRRLGLQDDGTLVPLAALGGLSDQDRAASIELRAMLEHFAVQEAGESEAARRQAAHGRLVREIGFTTFNRLVALRMAEERDLIQETVRNGLSSAGFQLFERIANGSLGSRAETYRVYLECLYDELAVDLPLLFSRSGPESRLFPSEPTLDAVLGLLSESALAELWREDETIGWVYQYFNDPDERKKMRDASQAPRSSRELAVRNQFFTPRYVVEFLTDNTLGRTWYEMRQGKTRLKDESRYLVIRPDEAFLGQSTAGDAEHIDGAVAAMARLLQEGTEETFPPFGSSDAHAGITLAACVDGYMRHQLGGSGDGEAWVWPLKQSMAESETLVSFSSQDLLDVMFYCYRADYHQGGGSGDLDETFFRLANEVRRRALESRRADLPQEERLRQPVFVPFRLPKDPRDLKVLDPACGSGHFLLYAFDLLETIYVEAWEDEHGPASLTTGTRLRDDYSDLEALCRAVAGLILRHNLYGVDIDPRAVQIAGLALWLRAQRSYQRLGLRAAERPPLKKGNLVVAEPMPGERELLEQFVARLDPPLVGGLVKLVFNKMELAGEAGTLLKIEEELRDAIRSAKAVWQRGPRIQQLALLPEVQRERADQLSLDLDVSGITDEAFWEGIEERVFAALEAFASEAIDGHATQRRLFAEDALQGFAFVDLCRKRFDVVLMNPPFGEGSRYSKEYLQKVYPRSKHDMLAAFVEMGLNRLRHHGLLGAITSRMAFYLVVHPPREYDR